MLNDSSDLFLAVTFLELKQLFSLLPCHYLVKYLKILKHAVLLRIMLYIWYNKHECNPKLYL